MGYTLAGFSPNSLSCAGMFGRSSVRTTWWNPTVNHTTRSVSRIARSAAVHAASPAGAEPSGMYRPLAKRSSCAYGVTHSVSAVQPPRLLPGSSTTAVLDTATEHLAVTEANKLGIPVVAVVDTNVNPNLVQYPIPGNDDAIRANELMTRVIAEAISEGRFIAEKAGGQVQNPATAVVDNAVFAADQARARAEAAIAQAERDAKLAGESN